MFTAVPCDVLLIIDFRDRAIKITEGSGRSDAAHPSVAQYARQAVILPDLADAAH